MYVMAAPLQDIKKEKSKVCQYVSTKWGGNTRHMRTSGGCVDHDDLQDLLHGAHAQVEGLTPDRLPRALLATRARALRPRLHVPTAPSNAIFHPQPLNYGQLSSDHSFICAANPCCKPRHVQQDKQSLGQR